MPWCVTQSLSAAEVRRLIKPVRPFVCCGQVDATGRQKGWVSPTSCSVLSCSCRPSRAWQMMRGHYSSLTPSERVFQGASNASQSDGQRWQEPLPAQVGERGRVMHGDGT